MLSTFKHWVANQPAGYFVEAKLAERDQRHARFGGTRYAVEPNVKDGKGGLRDLHTLFWISKYAYRLDHVRGVLGAGICGHLKRGHLPLRNDFYGLCGVFCINIMAVRMTGLPLMRKCSSRR